MRAKFCRRKRICGWSIAPDRSDERPRVCGARPAASSRRHPIASQDAMTWTHRDERCRPPEDMAEPRIRLDRLRAREVERDRAHEPQSQTVGIGAGQMSRVDAAKVAIMKSVLPDARLVRRLRRLLPLPRRPRPARRRRRHRHRSNPAAPSATPRSSPPRTSAAWRWSSQASGTSGTRSWQVAAGRKQEERSPASCKLQTASSIA